MNLSYQKLIENLAALKLDPLCHDIGTLRWVEQLHRAHRTFSKETEKMDLAQKIFVQTSNAIASNIEHYYKDGFKKICNVQNLRLAYSHDLKWLYTDINNELMYANHKSWVYFIVVDDQIQKVGETGNPLGIRAKNSTQPVWQTTCRLGRLATHTCNTDGRIRSKLEKYVDENRVSIWAKKCEMIPYEICIGGKQINTKMSFHKELELQYLDYMSNNYFSPPLNQGRK